MVWSSGGVDVCVFDWIWLRKVGWIFGKVGWGCCGEGVWADEFDEEVFKAFDVR